jgi:hypothetical protein
MPATAALSRLASVPARTARMPRRMAKEPRLAKPHRAKVTTATVLSDSSLILGPKSLKATNSLRISFSPRNEPAVTGVVPAMIGIVLAVVGLWIAGRTASRCWGSLPHRGTRRRRVRLRPGLG